MLTLSVDSVLQSLKLEFICSTEDIYNCIFKNSTRLVSTIYPMEIKQYDETFLLRTLLGNRNIHMIKISSSRSGSQNQQHHTEYTNQNQLATPIYGPSTQLIEYMIHIKIFSSFYLNLKIGKNIDIQFILRVYLFPLLHQKSRKPEIAISISQHRSIITS